MLMLTINCMTGVQEYIEVPDEEAPIMEVSTEETPIIEETPSE